MVWRYFFGAVIFYSFSIHTYIYDLYVMRKWLSEEKRYHYVIGLSDFHDRSVSQGVMQRQFILQKFALYEKKSTKLIVEDLSSMNDAGQEGCRHFHVQSTTGLLAGITNDCKVRGLDVENIEYRYCRVISLAPLLHESKKNSYQHFLSPSITLKELSAEIEKAIQSINSSYYHQKSVNERVCVCFKKIEVDLEKLGMNKKPEQSVSDYVACCAATPTDKLALIKKMLTFDSHLLDFKLLSAIMRSQHKKKAVVLAGGTHIKRVKDMLKSVGYETVFEMQPSFMKEYDVTKCHVASPLIQGRFCIKPIPLSDAILDKYL